MQVPISEADRHKTAFSTADGHFECTRIPFGLKAALSTFEQIMNSVLSELIGNRRLVYTNDILVLGETLNEHKCKLRDVFDKLREFNLKIEPEKCELLKN
jgi:hypothetical protein